MLTWYRTSDDQHIAVYRALAFAVVRLPRSGRYALCAGRKDARGMQVAGSVFSSLSVALMAAQSIAGVWGDWSVDSIRARVQEDR